MKQEESESRRFLECLRQRKTYRLCVIDTHGLEHSLDVTPAWTLTGQPGWEIVREEIVDLVWGKDKRVRSMGLKGIRTLVQIAASN